MKLIGNIFDVCLYFAAAIVGSSCLYVTLIVVVDSYRLCGKIGSVKGQSELVICVADTIQHTLSSSDTQPSKNTRNR